VLIPVFSLTEAANQLHLTSEAAATLARHGFLPSTTDRRGNFLFSESDLRKGRRRLESAGRHMPDPRPTPAETQSFLEAITGDRRDR
jgi:hypothetical protein